MYLVRPLVVQHADTTDSKMERCLGWFGESRSVASDSSTRVGASRCRPVQRDANYHGERYAQRTAPNTLSDHQLLEFDRHLYQSFLWVLAAYEFVRTLDQICRADRTIYGDALSKDVNHLKHQIERLRVPLAKLEPAGRHPTDSSIAYPAWVPHKGVAWQLDSSTIIVRVDLSEELLSLVEKLKAR